VARRIKPRKLPTKISFNRLSEATTKDLLMRYGALVQAVASARIRMSYGCCVEDLVSVGQIAILEAHVTYKPTLDCTQDTWTKRVVRWRIAEEAARYVERPLPKATDTERMSNGLAPDKLYDRAFAREAIGVLDPRRAAILQCRLHGYTCEEIGTQLGISASRVSTEEHRALEQLRVWADDEDVVD
jgi:RNA polymerase sigma factor (sigma-70 family)